MNRIFLLPKEAFVRWYRHDALLHSAALSFFTIVTLPALLILLISIGGIFLSDTVIQGEILRYTQLFFGERAVLLLERAISSLPGGATLQLRSLLGVLLVLVTASGLFSQIRHTMHAMWDIVEEGSGGIRSFFIRRLVLFFIVLVLGLLFVASILTEFLYRIASGFFVSLFPSFSQVFEWVGGGVSFLLIATGVALVCKYLPDVRIRWKDLLVGTAMSTSFLFVGKILIGWYFSQDVLQNPYGAAGSLFLLLLWIYYSSLVFLFGLQCTYVYAEWYGSGIHPARGARHRLSWRSFLREKWAQRRLFR